MIATKIRKSKYKYVYLITVSGREKWCGDISKYGFFVLAKTEHEAAKAIDIELIRQGKEPVNVLSRKGKIA